MQILSVSLPAPGALLAGRLLHPEGPGPWPAIVVTGSWTSVKEQMPMTWARALVSAGIAALVFDFRGWGETGGEPRYTEAPESKIEDILAAFDWLGQQPGIDRNRIGGLGLCASAGYMAHAAARSDLPRVLALVAPWLHDRDILLEVYGGAEGVKQLEALGRDKADVVIEAASASNADALMYQAPYYTEPARGLIPEWDNRFALRSWPLWLGFDGIAAAGALKTPVCLIHSDAAAIPQGARRFAERLGTRVTQHWLEGISQFDFYDRPDVVAQGCQLVRAHFIRHGLLQGKDAM